MADEVKISEKKLLYDPLFANKPDVDMKGRHYLKFKITFIVIILVFVGISLYFSFNSISSDKYNYKDTETGCQLYQFNGGSGDVTLHIDFFRDETGRPDETKPVTNVREFAVTCNEYVRFIFIGRDVKTLENHCFYYAKNLMGVIVDPENEYYTAVDGVLFNKDKTEIILHPVCNHRYRAALKAGLAAPSDEAAALAFLEEFKNRYGEETIDNGEEFASQFADEATYEIPSTVTAVADSCFSDCSALTDVKIPDAVKTIGSLAFFRCGNLESIYIPDGVESIGSDGFSYCSKVGYIFVPASVKSIGHHAFFGCLNCGGVIYSGAENEDAMKTGEQWMPKLNDKTLKNAEVLYGQTRRAD